MLLKYIYINRPDMGTKRNYVILLSFLNPSITEFGRMAITNKNVSAGFVLYAIVQPTSAFLKWLHMLHSWNSTKKPLKYMSRYVLQYTEKKLLPFQCNVK